jgi:hypothetical protein
MKSEAAQQMSKALQGQWGEADFWKHPLSQHPKDSNVWAAWLHLVTNLCIHQPEVVASAQQHLAPLLCRSLKTAPSSCHEAAWTAFLRLFSASPGALHNSAVTKLLTTGIAATVRDRSMSNAMASGLLPLTILMLKSSNEGLRAENAQAAWLSALLERFQSSTDAQAAVYAEAMVDVMMALLLHAGDDKQYQAVFLPTLQDLIKQNRSKCFATGLWTGECLLLGWVSMPSNMAE